MKLVIATLIGLTAQAAHAEDIAQMADRIGSQLEGVTQTLIGEAQRIEDATGPVQLPGGETISIDDLINPDPSAMAGKIGSSYKSLIGSEPKEEFLPDFSPEAFCREKIITAETGTSDYNICIMAEQLAYDTWKDTWLAMPGHERDFCLSMTMLSQSMSQNKKSFAKLAECLVRLDQEGGLKTFER